jgi:DNA topoisomerase-1
MAKNLVIVESPAKCKTISRYLGKDFVIKATMGHIIDLPEKELGVDIANDFKPKYTTSKGKRRIVKALKDDAKKAETIYLAPDPDREGEAIAWHVAQTIIKSNTNVKRVQFNEITKQAVLEAIKNPHDIDINKVNAQQARRILDRIVGYQVSPVLWRTVFRGLSAGRVQSVALRIICEREDDIKAFKQEEYWSIIAKITHNNFDFHAKLFSIDKKKVKLSSKDETDRVIQHITGKPFTVVENLRTEKSKKPFAPFITSTLQQEAVKKLGFSTAKSMMIAQQLYEGLELGELGSLGLITYMRTDSTRIADEALLAAKEVIKILFAPSYLPSEPCIYGKVKNAQDAHEAIRPSQVSMEYSPKNVKAYLTRDQYLLYNLIWKRFLASQMTNAVFDSTRIDIQVENCIFRSTGQVLKFDGFLAMYDETREEKNSEVEGQNDRLPYLEINTNLNVQNIEGRQHFTQPPPRYSEASLVRELEDKGIGRPSTYAQIIDTLKRRKYVDVINKKFNPTEVGFMVRKILTKEFSQIFDVGFTAEMETFLDKIEEGDTEWVNVLRTFYGPFEERLNSVQKDIKDLREQNQEVTDRICPDCNKFSLVIKWSRNGKFLACQGFPACKYTEPLQKAETAETDEVCDKCGAPMVVLNIKNNRFLGCSQYPKCKNTKSLSTNVPCPNEECEGMLIERSTKRGKLFYGCSEYSKCTFASWDRPVNEKCQKCGFPILVDKETKRKGRFKRCIKCKAEYPVENSDESEIETE